MFTKGFEKTAISHSAIARAINQKHFKMRTEAADIARKAKATKDSRLHKKYNDMLADGNKRFQKFDKRRKSIVTRLLNKGSDPDKPLKNWYKSGKTKWKERGLKGIAGAGLIGLAGAGAYSLDKLRKQYADRYMKKSE